MKELVHCGCDCNCEKWTENESGECDDCEKGMHNDGVT